MLRHVTIHDYGTLLKLENDQLVIASKGKGARKIPLKRIKSISVFKSGLSLTSNLLQRCAAYKIRFFFWDVYHQNVCGVYNASEHAVVKIRYSQFEFSRDSSKVRALCEKIIRGKIKNQRSVLQYFNKSRPSAKAVQSIRSLSESISSLVNLSESGWHSELLGIEGAAAAAYWKALRDLDLLPDSFKQRAGRGSREITNMALNFGYAVLLNRIWYCCVNAGLEPFYGFLHTERPGKPALVLDLMEEYRAWVVDRNIIKLRSHLRSKKELKPQLRKLIVTEIEKTLEKKVPYRNKRVKLEAVMQRQIYRLAGHFREERIYKPVLFKW